MARRFPAPWTVERIEGAFKVLDDTGQALAYVYFRTAAENADAPKVLTPARRGASLRISLSCRTSYQERRQKPCQKQYSIDGSAILNKPKISLKGFLNIAWNMAMTGKS